MSPAGFAQPAASGPVCRARPRSECLNRSALPSRLWQRLLSLVQFFENIEEGGIGARQTGKESDEIRARKAHRLRRRDSADRLASPFHHESLAAIVNPIYQIGKIPRRFGGGNFDRLHYLIIIKSEKSRYTCQRARAARLLMPGIRNPFGRRGTSINDGQLKGG